MGPQPNILLLIVDDLRPDLGCYGREWARTPVIDTLASESVTFLQAHAAVANCAPSRASLLTGLRPDTHGVLDLTTHVRERHSSLVTLPQRFRQAGYLSVSYGKIFHQFLDDEKSWSTQLEFHDNHTYRGLRGKAWGRAGGWDRGWRYNQYLTPENQAKQARTQRRRRRGDYSVSINGALPAFEAGPDERHPGSGIHDGAYTDALLATHAVDALRRLRAQHRPWLLAVGFVRPHLPFNAPRRFWDAAADAQGPSTAAEAAPPVGVSPLTAAHLHAGDSELFDFDVGRAPLRARSRRGRALARAYAAAVSFVDAQVGRVMSAIDGRGGAKANGTLVVLLGDHGWKLGHHGGWGKHTLLAADTHVPLIVRAPGFAPKRVHAPVELIDVYPTLLALAGLPPPPAGAAPPLEGSSLVPLMRRRSSRRRLAAAAAFSQWPLSRHRRHCMGYAVRTQGWTLIQWTPDRRAGRDIGGRACERSADLFRVRRNESRRGVLREDLWAAGGAGDGGGAEQADQRDGAHPAVVRRLRQRLTRTMRLADLGSRWDDLQAVARRSTP